MAHVHKLECLDNAGRPVCTHGERELRFPPGTKVKLTGTFLKNTGQRTGGAGLSKWAIVACDCDLCRDGNFVAVNEKALDYGQWNDIPKDQRPKWRHFNHNNLMVIGAKPRAKDYP